MVFDVNALIRFFARLLFLLRSLSIYLTLVLLSIPNQHTFHANDEHRYWKNIRIKMLINIHSSPFFFSLFVILSDKNFRTERREQIFCIRNSVKLLKQKEKGKLENKMKETSIREITLDKQRRFALMYLYAPDEWIHYLTNGWKKERNTFSRSFPLEFALVEVWSRRKRVFLFPLKIFLRFNPYWLSETLRELEQSLTNCQRALCKSWELSHGKCHNAIGYFQPLNTTIISYTCGLKSALIRVIFI